MRCATPDRWAGVFVAADELGEDTVLVTSVFAVYLKRRVVGFTTAAPPDAASLRIWSDVVAAFEGPSALIAACGSGYRGPLYISIERDTVLPLRPAGSVRCGAVVAAAEGCDGLRSDPAFEGSSAFVAADERSEAASRYGVCPGGSSITNRVNPSCDSHPICPPWARIMDWVIASPNPACSLLPSRRAGSAR